MDSRKLQPILSVYLRFNVQTPESAVSQIIGSLAEHGASYALSITFAGFANPFLAKCFLDAYCRNNPYSVLDIILETSSESEYRDFLYVTRKLPLASIPSMGFLPRFGANTDIGYRPQILRHVLCPVDRLFIPDADDKDLRYYAIVSGQIQSIKRDVFISLSKGWSDGAIVCSDGLTRDEGILLAIYVYMLFGRATNLRFFDPLLDRIYRQCLAQEGIAAYVLEGLRLIYDDAGGICTIHKPDEVLADNWNNMYRAVIGVLGAAIGEGVNE